MLPRQSDYNRAARRIETAIDSPAADLDAVIETLLTETADVLGVNSSCWHETDPASGSLISGAVLGEPPGSLEESLVYEYRRPDVNRFAELYARRAHVSAISTVTADRLSSARFREMIEPAGASDELRVAFSDAFGIWATLAVFTDRRMTEHDLRFLAGIVPAATGAMRRARAAQALDPPPPDVDEPPEPSVVIVDGSDNIVAADATARRRLALLHRYTGAAAPGVISFLAARARWDTSGSPATARMRSLDGRWFVLDASALDEAASGSVAVVMRPAPSAAVLDSMLRALGLSAREREVASHVVQGRSTKAIASALALSPWTVQDHLKSIYEKTGVGRSDLAALTRSAGEVR